MKKLSVLFIALMALLTACQQPDVSYAKIESMEFESDSYTLQENDEMSMAYRLTILPAEVGDTVTVKWSIADPSIATISDFGTLQALHEGKTTLTASAMGVKASCEIRVEPLKIKEFSIPSALTVYVNEPTEIEIADLSPKKAPLYRINWESTDKEVMPELVDNKKWMLTTDKIGTYTLTATTGKLEPRTCQVTVKIRPITTFKLDKTSLSLIEGQTDQLTLTLAPENASYADYEWRSTNTKVATVDKDGKVTAVGAGEATITVTHYPANDYDSMKEAECAVTVTKTPPITDFTLDKTKLEVERKKSVFIKVTNVLPEGASAATLKWSIEDPTIAEIKGGTSDGKSKQIDGLKAGQTTLTVSSSTGVSKKVTIKVLPIIPTGVTWNYQNICVWKGTAISLPVPTPIPADADILPNMTEYTIGGNTKKTNQFNTGDFDDGDYDVRVTLRYEDHNGIINYIKSDKKTLTILPTSYTATNGFDNPITDVYGTFGMSYDYHTFNYNKYTVKPTINGYVNISLQTQPSGTERAVRFNSDFSKVYYVQVPKAKLDDRISQSNKYISILSYGIKVTDGMGVTKVINAPNITLHNTFLGIAYNYSGDKAFDTRWNNMATDNLEMWMDDYAKGEGTGDFVTVSGKPTTAQAISLYMSKKDGFVTTLATESTKSWPADSYAPCYVGVEAASVLKVDPLKVIFKK